MFKSFLAKCVSLFVLFFVFGSSQQSFAQLQNRIVPFPEWSATFDDDDVVLELVSIEIGEQKISLGDPFLFDKNWLKEMKLSIRNVSKKSIASFDIGGGLLEGVDKELEPYQSYQYGIGWGWKSGAHPKKEFRPGQTIELNYSNVADLYKKVLAKVGEGSFYKLMFMAPNVKFKSGGTAPSPGMRFRVRTKK